MAVSPILAMTAAEIHAAPYLPSRLGYMACHFSPYTTGLSNCPSSLPPGSMLLLNDCTPICGHDPEAITKQLQQMVDQLECDSVLLDFQRPDCPETVALTKFLIRKLECPVGVSDLYARDLDCPVFLPPAPLDQPLKDHLAPWNGREIWLEAATDAACITVTEKGSSASPVTCPQPLKRHFLDQALHCWYWTERSEKEVRFYLWRDSRQLNALLEEAEALGISKAIGLYQQLGADR